MAWHIDYYLNNKKVVHDKNKYFSIYEAINNLKKQVDLVIKENGDIDKIVIQPWEKVHREFKTKQK